MEPILGYAIDHPNGLILFDTGMAEADPETEEHYRPVRRDFLEALRNAGVNLEQPHWIVNSHLHLDHCGGNRNFPRCPIVVQRSELARAHDADYTVLSAVDFEGATYHELQGEAELEPGVWVIPTPGHTEGHQSLVVRCEDGTVVCAGQAADSASEFASALLARQVMHNTFISELPPTLPPVERLLAFDPRRIVFAHDLSVVVPLDSEHACAKRHPVENRQR
jgi:metal-dependent hydrolase (beta-lactamase superfamily II)